MDIAKPVAILLCIFFGLLYGLLQTAQWAATFVPFKYEVLLAEQVSAQMNQPSTNADVQAAEDYLQTLADKIAAAKGLPDSMPITVHLILDDNVNAFATLGGHLFFHQGLLARLTSENALVMLLGHEIAHVYHRDPIQALGGTLLLGIFVEWITGGAGWGAAFVGDQAARLMTQGFSRDQERAADQFGAASLQALYGHTGGAAQLFEVLMAHGADSRAGIAEFWSSHPDTQERLAAFQQASSDAALTPLPIDFSKLSKSPQH